MTTLALPAPASLLDRAREHVRRAAETEPAWLAHRRAEALACVERRGLPTTRDEDWKYTNDAPFAALPLGRPAPSPAAASRG